MQVQYSCKQWRWLTGHQLGRLALLSTVDSMHTHISRCKSTYKVLVHGSFCLCFNFGFKHQTLLRIKGHLGHVVHTVVGQKLGPGGLLDFSS